MIGIIGALLASCLLPQLGVSLGGGTSRIVNATIGAVIVLVILRWSNAPDASPIRNDRRTAVVSC